ncbi:hypothetical protein GFL91_28660 [Rhizobium leguminosarum bv. viciae]|uniref:Uncharacterized protein n=2 Tax=Rhizobium leguminosarum TaxID=384 RepID=A0A8I2GV72_RHILV|nr:hypothetical protein [Rhizobium leguminosarum]NKM48846.1 hypothetical protein [Rhizobium leguminosarum bv. viciae]
MNSISELAQFTSLRINATDNANVADAFDGLTEQSNAQGARHTYCRGATATNRRSSGGTRDNGKVP